MKSLLTSVAAHLRTRAALAFAALTLALSVGLMIYGSNLWRGGSLTLWDWLGAAPMLVGPFLAGIVAWVVARDRGHSAERGDEVSASAGSRALGVVIAYTLIAVGVHLVVMGVLHGIVAREASVAHWRPDYLWLPIGAFITYGLVAALGGIVGLLLPAIPAAIVAAGVVLAVPLLTGLLPIPLTLWESGGGTGGPESLFVRGDVVFVRFVLLLLLLGVIWLLAQRAVRPYRLAGVGLLCAALVFGVGSLRAMGDSRFAQDASPLPMHCDRVVGTDVCLGAKLKPQRVRGYHQQLRRVHQEAKRLGVPWTIRGIEMVREGAWPDKVLPLPDTYRYIAGDIAFRDPEVASELFDGNPYLLISTLVPIRCNASDPEYGSTGPEAVLFGWLYAKAQPDSLAGTSGSRLSGMDRKVRDRWLKEAWIQVEQCKTPPPVPPR